MQLLYSTVYSFILSLAYYTIPDLTVLMLFGWQSSYSDGGRATKTTIELLR